MNVYNVSWLQGKRRRLTRVLVETEEEAVKFVKANSAAGFVVIVNISVEEASSSSIIYN